jgi:hypothetical protein
MKEKLMGARDDYWCKFASQEQSGTLD